MRCRKIDKLLESADYVDNKWLQLCADTATNGPGKEGVGGRQTEVRCATHREVFSVDGKGKLAIRRPLLTGKYTVMDVKWVRFCCHLTAFGGKFFYLLCKFYFPLKFLKTQWPKIIYDKIILINIITLYFNILYIFIYILHINIYLYKIYFILYYIN